MKNYKILFLLLAGFMVYLSGCQSDEAIVLPSSDYFVAISTASLNLPEGDKAVLSVYSGAQAGADINVEFKVSGTDKDGNPLVEGVDFQVLTADDQPMSTRSVTIANGIIPATFKIASIDDNESNAGRTITVSLTGNSANYVLGLDNGKKGKDIVLSIKDDENSAIEMSELLGSWTVTGQKAANWGQNEIITQPDYTITITQIDETTVSISNLFESSEQVVTAIIDLNSVIKTITIPKQEVPTMITGYRTFMSNTRPYYTTGDMDDAIAIIERDSSGNVYIYWDDVQTEQGYGYGYFLADASGALVALVGDGTYFYVATTARWVK
jgi:hypothetical protein